MKSIEILKINEQADKIDRCIRFDKGSAKFSFPSELLSLIDKVKQDISGSYFGYSAIGGERLLKERIAEFENQGGRNVSVDDIVITHGGMSGIFTALGAITESGDEVITSEYFFEAFAVAFDYFKLKHLKVNLNDAQALKDVITKNTKVIVLNSPENPTGRVYSQREVNSILRIAQEHGIFVLSDEVTNKIIYDHAQWADPALEQQNVIAINSFSKNWFIPGIRVGWNISKNPELNKHMGNFLSVQSIGVNYFGQILMAEALAKINYQIFAEPYMKILSNRRDVMKKALDQKNIQYFSNVQGGMNFYVDIKGNSREIAFKLLNECGVAVIPGNFFEGKASHYIRVGFGAVDENEIFEGIDKISRII